MTHSNLTKSPESGDSPALGITYSASFVVPSVGLTSVIFSIFFKGPAKNELQWRL